MRQYPALLAAPEQGLRLEFRVWESPRATRWPCRSSGSSTESSSRASSEGGWRPSTMAVMMSPDPSCTADENDQCCSGGCCQLLAACFNSADGSMPISTPFSGRLLVAITQQVRAPSCCAIRRSPFYWLLSDRFRRTSRSPLPAEADADTSAGGTFYR
jgi:hypothetical protein